MTTAVLHVERAGPLVTFQDAGRPGLLRFGVPASGPMDRFAHDAANTVVGQPLGSTAIEVSLGGLTLACTAGSVTVALCGGGFNVRHAGEPCTSWTVRTLHTGDTFAISPGAWGSWCYLAVAGEIRATRWLDSAATHVRSGLGGGILRTSADIVIDDARVDEARNGPVEPPALAHAAQILRIVLGPQLDRFQPDAAAVLLGQPFALTTAYDRMGVRLQGPTLALDNALAIPSSPIVRGSIQVAGDGVPTLLFADHQTTGGYPKIATVIADDVARAARLRAGDLVTFTEVGAAEAVAAARAVAVQRVRELALLAERPGVRTRLLLGTNLISGLVDPEE